jgi:hypothetical protein
MGSGVEVFTVASRQAGLFAEAKLSMERMAREISDAAEDITDYSSNHITFTKSHSSPEDSSTEITFQVSGGVLQRTGNASTTEPMAENVSNFNVTNNSNEIELELTLSLVVSETLTQNITLRTKINPKNLPFDPNANDFGGAKFNGDWEEVVVP